MVRIQFVEKKDWGEEFLELDGKILKLVAVYKSVPYTDDELKDLKIETVIGIDPYSKNKNNEYFFRKMNK